MNRDVCGASAVKVWRARARASVSGDRAVRGAVCVWGGAAACPLSCDSRVYL